MKKKLFELIVEHQFDFAFGDKSPHQDIANEITKHITAFIKWKDAFVKYDAENDIYIVMVETHVVEDMNLNRVYDFWLKNIANE